MTAPHVTGSGAIVPPEGMAAHVEALMELSAAAHAIHPHSTSQARQRLANAVAKILRMFRLHGLAAAPLMAPAEAEATFRAALRLALAVGVPRDRLVLIFNNEEDAPEGARRDLQ